METTKNPMAHIPPESVDPLYNHLNAYMKEMVKYTDFDKKLAVKWRYLYLLRRCRENPDLLPAFLKVKEEYLKSLNEGDHAESK